MIRPHEEQQGASADRVERDAMTGAGLHERILEVVARVPRGRVATYGQVARMAGLPRQARLVGYAMHALPSETKIPWHRVVNAHGMVSTTGEHAVRQQRLLQREGVRFDERGRIDLDRFQWKPRTRHGAVPAFLIR